MLYVDRTADRFPATLPPGSVTRTDTFATDGLRLGSEPDGTQALNGSLDDVQFLHAALDTDQVTTLLTGTAPTGLSPALSLPFDIQADQSYPQM